MNFPMTLQLRLLCASSAALLSACIYYPQSYYQYPARPSYPGYYAQNGPGPGSAGNYYRTPGQDLPPGAVPPATPYPQGKIFEEPTLDTDTPRDERPSDDAPPPSPSNNTPPPSGPDSTDKPATKKPLGQVPTALKTKRPGHVKSPYPPNNELDVTGLPSGSLAKDPATGQIFRVP